MPLNEDQDSIKCKPSVFLRFWPVLVSVLVFSLDQWTKWLIQKILPIHNSISILPQILDLTHVRNTGAAFGLMAGPVSSSRTIFFGIITLFAIIVIFSMFFRTPYHYYSQRLGLALILGGAIGNFIDRLLFGMVTDFIDVHYKDIYHWPAFNVADSCISIGMVLLVWNLLFFRKENTQNCIDPK